MNKSAIVMIATIAIVSVPAIAQEEDDAKSALEPQAGPPVEFLREGHLDVSAKSRTLAWNATDRENLKTIEIQVVKVTDGAKPPEVLYRSSEPSGRVDLVGLRKGPGLYGILANTTDANGNESRSGMRFSYAELNPDCPTDKAWWAGRETVDFQAQEQEKPETDVGLSPRNLLSLSRHASHAVTGVVTTQIACPTEEGSLFTYVVFDDVRPLGTEGDSDTPRELVLRVPGGMAHGRVEIVTDAPIFRKGDRVLVFLSRDPQTHMPIVGGAFGVFLIESGDLIRSYSGPNVVGISDNYDIELDPNHKLDPAHLRHYDPNMRAVVNDPRTAPGIGTTQKEKQAAARRAMSIKEFAEKLDAAWSTADRLGRIPSSISFDERPPYNSLPTQQPRS